MKNLTIEANDDIVRAILNGTQPVHFDLKFLKQFRALPIDWTEQRKLLGF